MTLPIVTTERNIGLNIYYSVAIEYNILSIVAYEPHDVGSRADVVGKHGNGVTINIS